MKTKKLMCGIVALVLMALATGCPTGTTEGAATYILSGTVGADIDGVDYTQVSIQLIRNGNPIFKPVHPAEDGSFAISGVPAGGGFAVRAMLDGFAIAETDVFSVPEEGTGLELWLKPIASISGSVTVDEDGIDFTAVDVILYFMEGEIQRIHPDADGKYVFTGVGQKKSMNYKVAAELAGFDKAVSRFFALTGDYTVPALALKGIPPEITGCDFVEADKLIITFSGPVEIVNLDGFEFMADFGPLSIVNHQMNGDCELELAMDRTVSPIEKIDVHYNSTKQSLKQKGTDRYLHRYFDRAGKSFSVAKPLTASFAFGGGGMPASGLTIVWSRDIEKGTFTTMQGWSISSDGGDIDFMMMMLSDNRMAMVLLTRAPAKGEVVTIAYDAAVGLVEAAEDGSKLASFETTLTVK